MSKCWYRNVTRHSQVCSKWVKFGSHIVKHVKPPAMWVDTKCGHQSGFLRGCPPSKRGPNNPFLLVSEGGYNE